MGPDEVQPLSVVMVRCDYIPAIYWRDFLRELAAGTADWVTSPQLHVACDEEPDHQCQTDILVACQASTGK